MLAFTPDVTAALDWFDATHQVASDFGRAYWRQVSLPATGGAGDQDAWLMQALEVLRDVHDTLLREAATRARNEDALKQWRAHRQQNGRT